MSLKPISPQDARELMRRGAALVDIRAADEHARERIAQARHVPMDRLQAGSLPLGGAPAVIFHCRSGNRTRVNASALRACAACDAYFLEGGLDAWKKAGLPVVADASQPLELQRQVQIAAGSLIVLGAVLGVAVSPWFHALSAFVGAGLVFAGASGFCGLARVLMRMPWNRNALAG
ncbi:rhodanese family protein [Ottowia sp. VDI28]|uniref:rhodanese family protein n=1 Tax=Ottowia sp. VDI28 TaxID=3133968 RepID=UPI003C2EBC0C